MFYRIPEFNYHRPGSLDEVLELMYRLDDAKILAGGTILLNEMRMGRCKPRNIVDISGVRELDYVVDEDRFIRIGAGTRLQDLIDYYGIVEERIPLLYQAVYSIASWQIRNIATIGGNLCGTPLAGDTAPPLLVHGARLKIQSLVSERIVSLEDFFMENGSTVLGEEEVLTEIIVPVLKDYGFSYVKFGRRSSFTLPIVSVATAVKVSGRVFRDVRIALGSVAPRPVRARSVEEYLRGREVSLDVIEEASRLVVRDISPFTDTRASASYRREVSMVLVRDAIVSSLESLGVRVKKKR